MTAVVGRGRARGGHHSGQPLGDESDLSGRLAVGLDQQTYQKNSGFLAFIKKTGLPFDSHETCWLPGRLRMTGACAIRSADLHLEGPIPRGGGASQLPPLSPPRRCCTRQSRRGSRLSGQGTAPQPSQLIHLT